LDVASSQVPRPHVCGPRSHWDRCTSLHIRGALDVQQFTKHPVVERSYALQINEPKFVDEFDDEALKFLTLVDGWSLSACPALVVDNFIYPLGQVICRAMRRCDADVSLSSMLTKFNGYG
jgi:hypothetical protein